MENDAIQFSLEDKTFEFKELVIELLDNSQFFLDCLLNQKEGEYVANLNNKSIKISDLDCIRVNIKDVGSFDLFFEPNSVAPLEIAKDLSTLKEIEVTNIEQAKEKVIKAFSLVKINPLFSLYSPKGEFSLSKESLSLNTFVLVLNKGIEPKVVAEKQDKKQIAGIGDVFAPIKANGSHYAFILISTFLIGFATSIGVFYQHKGDSLYFFFYACTAIGAIINLFVYIDFFKRNKIISLDFLYTVIDILIAVGITFTGFYIFYDYQKEIPESLSSMTPVLLITLAVIVITNVILCAVGWFIGKRKSVKNSEDE